MPSACHSKILRSRQSRSFRLVALYCLAVLALTASSIARADIILFDMHLSNSEVRAAYAAAQKRGEDLIVLPKVSLEARLLRRTLPGKIARLTKKLETVRAQTPNESALEQLTSELTATQEKWQEISAGIPKHVNAPKLLTDALTDLSARGRLVTSLIGSGESTGIGFEGDVGGVYRADLKAVFDKFPEQRDALQSVFLWGCYTANRDDVVWWQESFPKLKAIFGFSGRAPLENDPDSYLLLRDALEQSANMAGLTSTQEIRRAFHRLDSVGHTHAAAVINSTYLGVDIEPFSIALPPQCESAEKLLRRSYTAFTQCYSANAGCLSPPTNTQSSPLRTFYSDLQSYGGCAAYSTFIASLPAASKVISLIYYDRVRRHFARFYDSEIEAANALLEGSEFNLHKTRFPDPTDKSISRMALISKILYLEQQVSAESSSLKGNPQLQSLLSRAKTLLRSLECVPTSWATEDESVDRPPDAPGC